MSKKPGTRTPEPAPRSREDPLPGFFGLVGRSGSRGCIAEEKLSVGIKPDRRLACTPTKTIGVWAGRGDARADRAGASKRDIKLFPRGTVEVGDKRRWQETQHTEKQKSVSKKHGEIGDSS